VDEAAPEKVVASSRRVAFVAFVAFVAGEVSETKSGIYL